MISKRKLFTVSILTLLFLSMFASLNVGVWQIKPVQATNYFTEDFEAGNANTWTDNDSVIVDATYAHFGSYGGHIHDAVLYESGVTYTTLYSRLYIRFIAFPTSGTRCPVVQTWGSVDLIAGAGVVESGGVMYWEIEYKNTSNTILYETVSSPTPILNTWYCMELQSETGSGTGIAAFQVGGVTLLNKTGLTTPTGSTGPQQRVQVGVGLGSYTNGELDLDDIVIADGLVGTLLDVSNIGVTNSYTGVSCVYYALFIPPTGQNMSYFIFGSNTTGQFTNSSAVAFSAVSGSQWGNATITNNDTLVTIQRCTYSNDTAGNWIDTGLQNNTLVYPLPTYSGISLIGQKAGSASHLDIQWTAVGGTTLSMSILCWNSTGSFTNTTSALSGTSAWHNFTGTANSTVGNVIVAWFYANNSLNQFTQTTNVTYVTYNDTMALHFVGKNAYDDNNNLVRFVGLNVGGIGWIDSPWGDWIDSAGTVHWGGQGTTDLYQSSFIPYVKTTLDAVHSWNATCIRAPSTVEWWLNSSYSAAHIADFKNFTAEAQTRGIYVVMTYWRINQTEGQSQPWEAGNAWCSTSSEFTDLWISIALEMRGYSNVLFEFWNEPSETEPTLIAVMQNTTDWIRKYAANPVVAQNGVVLSFDLNNPTRGYNDLEWIASSPLNDTVNNVVYSHHCYRVALVNGSTRIYTIPDLIIAYTYQYYINYTVNVLNKPLWIGEIGPNQWETGDELLREYAWYNNTLYLLNEWGVGYCAWEWWVTGIAWCHIISDSPNYPPNPAGDILISWMTETVPVIVTITSPANTTYTISTAPVEISASGGTIDTILWNCTYTNGTVAYANTVYTTPTSMTLGNGSYIFNAYANNTDGEWDEATVAFTVSIPSTPPTSVTLIIASPTNTTYSSSTVPISMSASGGTIDTIWWNIQFANASWLYAENQTYTVVTSATIDENLTATFYGYANNTDGNGDEGSVMFTVYLVSNTIGYQLGQGAVAAAGFMGIVMLLGMVYVVAEGKDVKYAVMLTVGEVLLLVTMLVLSQLAILG